MNQGIRLSRSIRQYLAALAASSVMTGFASMPQQSLAAPAQPPAIAKCGLETTQRAAFRVDNLPEGATPVGLRISLYDAKKIWLADEMVSAGELDASIPPISGLLDPQGVASVRCSIAGHFSMTPGETACPLHGGLIVDGGPDAQAERIVSGKDWIYLEFEVFVNHFFANQETDLHGDVLQARLDRGSMQRVVVSGSDPQRVSLLFTGVSAGFHEIDYGPWVTGDSFAINEPYHNVCLRV